MKFGVFLPTYYSAIPNLNFLVEAATQAEEAGLSSIWVADHLFYPKHYLLGMGGDPNKPYGFEVWTTMATLAILTKRVTIGPLVTPLPLYHPAVIAREASMLDVISEGRFILGVGAGWYKQEFLSYGIPWDKFSTRIMKLKEEIEIIRRLWTMHEVSFDGDFYKLRKVPFGPKPIQQPYPPIWLGGSSKSILDITAEFGNGWIPGLLPDYTQKLSAIQETAVKLGRNPEEIEAACVVPACISYDESVLKNFKKNYTIYANKPFGVIEEQCIYGAPDVCTERIKKYERGGVEHLVLQFYPPTSLIDQIRVFGQKIISNFS